MELDIWEGDFGLPSIDTNCLQVLAYTRFSGVPVKVNPTNNPWFAHGGTLPVFRHTKVNYNKFSEVVSYLRKQNYSADFNLTKKEIADISAYSSMLQARFDPLMSYMWFVEERNYVELTRPWYAKRLPFPSNYTVPGQMQRRAEADHRAQFSEYDEVSTQETALLKEAQKCLTLLSEKLGDQEFFFGRQPTSFDAIVFSYLAPMLKVPFPSFNHIQTHLKACDNLTSFISRILQKYFPTNRNESAPDSPSSYETGDFPHKRRDIVLSGLFATTAMISYAFLIGVLKIERVAKT